MRLLIIGFGSIGKRHHRNALALGIKKEDIQIVDPRVPSSPSLDEAFAFHPHGVLICTPFHTHYEIAKDVLEHTDAGVFIEKPLCKSLEEAASLVEMSQGRVTQVGYCWRFHRTVITAMNEINNLLQEGKRPTHVKLKCYSCRAMWPGFASTYGDVIYEASHELDLARYCFGANRVKFGQVKPGEAWVGLSAPREHVLATNTDDLDIDCELVYVTHPNGECRTLAVAWDDYTRSEFNLRHPSSAIAPMYQDELKAFVQALTLRKPITTAATIQDGASVVEMIHHAKQYDNNPHR